MGCVETFSTLRIFSPDLEPSEITKKLQLQPSKSRTRNLQSKYRHEREVHAWFLSTEGMLESTASEDHLQHIVTELEGREGSLRDLRENGCKTSITSYWVGDGQGGPSLSPELMQALSSLGLSIWWDNYFEAEDDT